MNCLVHRARMIIWRDADYFFSLHNYFSFIIVSVCVTFIFHLHFTLCQLLDYMLYQIVPVSLLQAYNFTSTHQ